MHSKQTQRASLSGAPPGELLYDKHAPSGPVKSHSVGRGQSHYGSSGTQIMYCPLCAPVQAIKGVTTEVYMLTSLHMSVG